MKSTTNLIIIFFLVMPLLLLSYQIGTPENISLAKSNIGEYIKTPLFLSTLTKSSNAEKENRPQRNFNEPEPDLTAISALAWDTKYNAILLDKNSNEIRPIASLTKLITAAVVLDYDQTDETTAVSRKAIQNEGDSGNLKEGEILTIYNLLGAALIESSNDAAYALAEYTGHKIINSGGMKASTVLPIRVFVKAMNQKFNNLNLTQSYFTDSSGLEDVNSFSTATDLSKFIKYLREGLTYVPIWQITQLKKMRAVAENGLASHEFTSTNPFLNEFNNVIGGKTGYTSRALGNMILILKSPDEKSEIVYIILGSEDRFGDMRKLVKWSETAWRWPNK
ncbi:MAG: serine hydrolase [Patescibacteria group bacterium]